MLNAYNSFHQTVKYGNQRNPILQDLTWIEIKFLRRLVKLKTDFQQPQTGLPKKPALASLVLN